MTASTSEIPSVATLAFHGLLAEPVEQAEPEQNPAPEDLDEAEQIWQDEAEQDHDEIWDDLAARHAGDRWESAYWGDR